jgi:hypothetical protein
LANLESELLTAQPTQIEPILSIKFTPEWAQLFVPYTCGPIRSDKFEAFAKFMEQLVIRYGSSSPYGVRYWQIGNELDLAPVEVVPETVFGCWGDANDPYFGGGYYAQMLKVVYPRIKAADPGAQLIMGGLLLHCDPYVATPSPDCIDGKRFRSGLFLEGMMREGGGDYFDIADVHSYGLLRLDLPQKMHSYYSWSGGVGGTGLPQKVNFVRQVLARYGHGDKPLFAGEIALKCEILSPECYEVGAAFVPRAYAEAYSLDLLGAVYYALISEFYYKGLLLPDFTPKPAYWAYKFMSSQLTQARYEGPVTTYPGVSGHAFSQAGQQQVQIVWSSDGFSKTVTLASNFAAAFDKLGFPLTPVAGQLVVDWSPIYISTQPISVTLTPASFPVTLTYTDSQSLPTRLDFPAGAVSGPTDLFFNPSFAKAEADLVAFTNHTFNLSAYQNGNLQPNLALNKPVTVTIYYSEADIQVVSDESQLMLFWWDGAQWSDAVQTCNPSSTYTRDLANNTISLPICRVGRFALFGPTNQVYLPIIPRYQGLACLTFLMLNSSSVRYSRRKKRCSAIA